MNLNWHLCPSRPTHHVRSAKPEAWVAMKRNDQLRLALIQHALVAQRTGAAAMSLPVSRKGLDLVTKENGRLLGVCVDARSVAVNDY